MINNERLEKLATGEAWTCIQDDEGTAMARELLVLRKMPQWISCEELVPESTPETYSRPVAALTDTGDVFRLSCQGNYWQRTKAFIESGSKKVTHWMPLPEGY